MEDPSLYNTELIQLFVGSQYEALLFTDPVKFRFCLLICFWLCRLFTVTESPRPVFYYYCQYVV